MRLVVGESVVGSFCHFPSLIIRTSNWSRTFKTISTKCVLTGEIDLNVMRLTLFKDGKWLNKSTTNSSMTILIWEFFYMSCSAHLQFPLPVVSIIRLFSQFLLNLLLLIIVVAFFALFTNTHFIFQILDSLNEINHHSLYFDNFLSQLSNRTYISLKGILMHIISWTKKKE